MMPLALMDDAVVARLNRINRHHAPGVLFAWISRLGDGWFWYALMALLPLWPWLSGQDCMPGLRASVIMGVAGIAGTCIYRLIKQGTRRPRPCEVHHSLALTVEPLDRFSFPSGHTLHAVAFTVIACAHAPVLAWGLVPFTLLVAGSRMVLGLHYPSDVLAGAGIGGLCAWVCLQLSALVGWTW